MKKWNGNRFSIYASEEKNVLGLIEELGGQANANTDALANKTDLTGDHKGSWQGLQRPTMSEEGLRATVEKIVDEDLPRINSSLENKANIKNVVYINALDLGFKVNDLTFDCTPLYKQLITELPDRSIIYFPNGNFYWSECLISNQQRNGMIKGTSFPSSQWGQGTVFKPFTSNQDYIMKLGGNADYSISNTVGKIMLHGFWIDGVTFSTNVNGVQKEVNNAMLHCEYIANCKLNIGFCEHTSTALFIRNSWEVDINNIFIRPKDGAKEQIVFGAADSGGSNLSRIHILHLDTEYRMNSYTPLLKILENSQASNILIDTISYESITPTLSPSNLEMTTTDFLGFTKYPLFEINGVNGLTIGEINLTTFSDKYDLNSVNDKAIDSLFRLTNKCVISVNSIILGDSGSKLQLVDGQGSLDSMLYVGSLIGDFTNRTPGTSYGVKYYRELKYFNQLQKGVVKVGVTNYKYNSLENLIQEELTVEPNTYSPEDIYNKIVRVMYKGVNDNTLVQYNSSLGFNSVNKVGSTEEQITSAIKHLTDCDIYITYQADNDFKISSALADIIVPSNANFVTYKFEYSLALHKIWYIKATNLKIRKITIVPRNEGLIKKINTSITVTANQKTGVSNGLGITRDRLIGIIVQQSNDVYYCEPTFSVTSDTSCKVQAIVATTQSVDRVLNIIVSYI